MARIDNLTNFLTDVANSIRNKKGSDSLILAENFDTEIESIQTENEPTESNVVYGSFTPSENYVSDAQFLEFQTNFRPTAVYVYREVWVRGTQSINAAFASSTFNFSICNTANSSKAAEKMLMTSTIEILDNGFKISGDTTYYLVGDYKYNYVIFK